MNIFSKCVIERIENDKKNFLLLLNYLQKFDPPLSDSVNLEAYAEKIIRFAYIYEARYNGQFAGIVAFYMNENYSFITFIAVSDEYQGTDVSQSLLEIVFENSRKEGVLEIRLEVFANNERAKEFYVKSGFRIHICNSSSYVLTKLL